VFRLLLRSLLFSLLLSLSLSAQTAPAKAPTPPSQEWVKRSNAIATEVLTIGARVNPEAARQSGIEGFDDKITDFGPDLEQRQDKAFVDGVALVKEKLATEKDPLVREDLQIMLTRLQQQRKGTELNRKYFLPYVNTAQFMFSSLQGLLDEQVKPEKRQLALVRLRKYAGMEPGTKPTVELIEERIDRKLADPGLLAPSKLQFDKNLQTSRLSIDGIESLFKKFGITGYEEPYAALKKQLTDYDGYVREKIVPKARPEFRLPQEVYQFQLEQFGIDIPQEQLLKLAHRAYDEIRAEMQTVAARVAKEHKLPSSDYHDVIRELKQDQLVGDAILPHYQQRLKEIEGIIRAKNIVSLPERPARIRIGTPAENAQQPAPHMVPPRLLGNTGEQGEFVLPLTNPGAMNAKAGKEEKMDDFTYAAASWTLTAHEARPGHELQFASMIEHGVSAPRALFAFNSTNVEGWGLYSEWLMLPYMPADGQLVSLQLRLQRAVRAFTDPELQQGKQTPDGALDLLQKEVGLSGPMASQEVERYTFRSPGQATSYFYGMTRLLQLRKDVQKAMGKSFDQKKFHDFILAQGLLPPDLLRKTVFANFVKKPDPGASSLDQVNYAQEANFPAK
jgi:hypothetical protein